MYVSRTLYFYKDLEKLIKCNEYLGVRNILKKRKNFIRFSLIQLRIFRVFLTVILEEKNTIASIYIRIYLLGRRTNSFRLLSIEDVRL